MQDFESELLPWGTEHSQKVKAVPHGSDAGSKDCVNLSSSTAVSRIMAQGLLRPVWMTFEEKYFILVFAVAASDFDYRIKIRWRLCKNHILHVSSDKGAFIWALR